jgi:hypothetical protein
LRHSKGIKDPDQGAEGVGVGGGRWTDEPAIIVEVNMTPGDANLEKSADPKKGPSFRRRYLGILFALMSSIVFSLCSIIIKVLGRYHPFNLGFWRFQGKDTSDSGSNSQNQKRKLNTVLLFLNLSIFFKFGV